ncbi:MFS transporter, MCP family, solute carrier family 16, member 10, variant [Xylogone sp. PMI_703]|nr:MFS transporter, MCP family, solute carrier family 16, member 10, variant [Xylogone sp. PMI_703]
MDNSAIDASASTSSSRSIDLDLDTETKRADKASSQIAVCDVEKQTSSAKQQLPPTDQGLAAWTVLCAAFIFEALLWGFLISFGVFQNYYYQLPQFAKNPYIPVVGTIASGISYLGAPFMVPVVKKYARYQRHMIWVGWITCILSLIAGSFVTTLPGLIVTQGVMYGLGVIIFYSPMLSMLSEWWVARRGMAFGVVCSATGFTGVAMPFIVEKLLSQYGYPTTLRAIAIALIILTGPLLPFFKGRLPPPNGSDPSEKTDWSFLRKTQFWVYSISNLLQGFGYFFPQLFLPSYATSIRLSSVQGAMLLAIMSVTQVMGQMIFGYLSDHRLSLDLLIMGSTIISGVAAVTLWGLARSLAPLIFFALIYGFFGAGYVSLWSRMGTAVTQQQAAAFMTFSLFSFGKGLGNVLAGPISAGLLSHSIVDRSYGMTKYQGVIVFMGICMLSSAAIVGAWHICVGQNTKIELISSMNRSL